MNLCKIILCSFVMLIISNSAIAADAPIIVINAFKAYQSEGFDGAFAIWTKDSLLENDKLSLMNMRGGFTQIETTYGKMVGYIIIKVNQITESTIRTYAGILYEKGPVYMYVDCSKADSGWIISKKRSAMEA